MLKGYLPFTVCVCLRGVCELCEVCVRVVVYVTVCLLYIQCHKHTQTHTLLLPLPSRTRIKYTLRCTPELKGLTYCTPIHKLTHTAHGCPCNSFCLIPNAFDVAAQCSPLRLPLPLLSPLQILHKFHFIIRCLKSSSVAPAACSLLPSPSPPSPLFAQEMWVATFYC